MPEYPQPGTEQRSQQHFVIFDRFKGVNTQSARAGLPNDQLAWLENLQPLAENKLLVVPAAAQAAAQILTGTAVLEFYAAMNNQDWLIFFTAAGGGLYYNITTGISGQFAPNGTFSTAPDCTTWQADRILINDSVAGYCTWDGTVFVQQGSVSPNIEVTGGGSNYFSPPIVSLVVNGTGGINAVLVAPGSWTGTPTAGNQPLSIGAPGAGGIQAVGYATVVGPSPFSVASVTITNQGSGYSSLPNITLAVTGGTAPTITAFGTANGASAHAIIQDGQVVDVVLDTPGTGLQPTDTIEVIFTAPPSGSGAALSANMSGTGIASITITNAGRFGPLGSPNNPVGTHSLTIGAPPAGGTQATATVQNVSLGGGVVNCQNAILTGAGAGYVTAPLVTLPVHLNPGEIQPTFAASMGNQSIVSISGSAGGSGYPPSANLPLIFTPSGGAAGFATTNGSGVVVSATITNGGSFPFGTVPTITVAGSGATPTASAHVWPFVTAGTTLAVFQQRVFLGGGQLLQWSGTGATAGYNNQGFDDFLVADLSGALQITDADLVHNITALRSFNNYLWVVGDQSIKQIGSLFPSGAPPFQLLTLSSDQGTIWPRSCVSFNRIFLFANPNGVFGVFGSTVQKISDDLDGIFQNATFAQQVQGAVFDLNSKHNAVFMVRYNDPVAGTRSLLLVFDGKRWWFANQGAGLVTIATAPIFATDLNQLWGSVTGTDITRLLADPTTAVPFKISTALAHNDNPVQGKRVIRAGFTASAAVVNLVAMTIDTEGNGTSNNMWVNDAVFALSGGASDAVSQPIGGSGVYLGMTISGTMSMLTLHNMIIEYQETSLWGPRPVVLPPVPPVAYVDVQGNVFVDQRSNVYVAK